MGRNVVASAIHSVPQFCLQNISVAGKFYHSGNLVDMPMLNKDKGIGEAGTFKIICRECDSSVFNDYENPEAYYQGPTDKMLAQIAKILVKGNWKFNYIEIWQENLATMR